MKHHGFIHNSLSATRAAGFTLLELMTTLTIAAILLSIGVPSFRYVTTANRASSEINALLGDLQLARAEALREGVYVTVCASTDGATCAGATAWNTGWIVFTDAPPLTTLEPGDRLVKIQRPF